MTAERTSPKPIITVAMSVRDNASTVGEAVRSILTQTYGDFEFVIVNDGSRDSTACVLAQFSDPRIRVISHPASAGLAVRLNEIVALARGEFIARMDGDDFSYPERLESQLAFLREHPGIDLTGAGAIAFRPMGTPIGAFRVQPSHDQICSRPEAGFGLPHPTWFGRAAWFRRFPYRADVGRAEDQLKLLAAYQTSRFANLTAPLLGYRQDIPRVRHITNSRLPYLRVIAQQALQAGEWGLMGRAAVQQIGRTAITVAELGLGRGERMLARRFRAITGQELARFNSVRNELMSTAT
jgi:glycosyltransferase involved in cell wall biosynthesis